MSFDLQVLWTALISPFHSRFFFCRTLLLNLNYRGCSQCLAPIFPLTLSREIVTSHATRQITGVFHMCANFCISLSLVITELELGFELHIPVLYTCLEQPGILLWGDWRARKSYRCRDMNHVKKSRTESTSRHRNHRLNSFVKWLHAWYQHFGNAYFLSRGVSVMRKLNFLWKCRKVIL